MKVLIAVPCLELPGGVANYYRTLRPYLDADKVYFEIGSRSEEDGLAAATFRLVADFWRFHRMLSRQSWDLVHINPSMIRGSIIRDGLFLLIARAHRTRVLAFFRGWVPAYAAQIRSRHTCLFRWVYGRATAFVVLGAEFSAYLEDIGIHRPTFMATTVVDDAMLTPPADQPANAPAGKCDILFLSRLDKGKGLSEAIAAFARVRSHRPEVTLTIAGDGPERAAAQALVQGRGLRGVSFVGHLDGDARAEAFRRADIFLFPTAFGEGMPNAVLEAMAFGLPVVTRPVGGIRDFFEDGRMGYMTESQDPAVFGEILARLVADPALRASMGRYNREYARRRFAATVVAARLLEIYGQVGRQAAAG